MQRKGGEKREKSWKRKRSIKRKIYIYIYIYTHTERERERERERKENWKFENIFWRMIYLHIERNEEK